MKFPRIVVLPRDQACDDDLIARPVVGEKHRIHSDVAHEAVATRRERGRFILSRREGRNEKVLRELIQAAMQGLESTPYRWRIVETTGALWFRKPSLLRVVGPEEATGEDDGLEGLSSDLLVRSDIWEEALALLRSEILAVVVPKRGWLLAAKAEPKHLLGLGGLEFPHPILRVATNVGAVAGQLALSPKTVFFIRSPGHLQGIGYYSGSYYQFRNISPVSTAWLEDTDRGDRLWPP